MQIDSNWEFVIIQVALLGLAKSFQKDLNEIAEKVEASNQRWYKFILTGNADSKFLLLKCSCTNILQLLQY